MAEFPTYAVIDGGVTTEIIAENNSDEIYKDRLWGCRFLIKDPGAIKRVHKRFLECGADIIETTTYYASIPVFTEQLGISAQESVELIKSAVHLAQQVRDSFWKDNKQHNRIRPLVAGSVSPYAGYLYDFSEYHGRYVDTMEVQDLVEFHRPVVQALLEAGVDLLALETVPAQKEAEAFLLLLREFPDARAMLCLSCKDGEHTCHGEKLADVLKLTIPCQQVVATGVNCTSPLYIESLLKSIPEEVRVCKRLAVYPNSGEDWDVEKREFSGKEGCPKLAPLVSKWLDSGANWVGGCCRTTSQDVADIKAEMTSWLKQREKK